MASYHAQHDTLFRTVAEILVRDYIAPSETAETVAEWCEGWCWRPYELEAVSPSELAALIADVDGYKKR